MNPARNPARNGDEQWLREELSNAVPPVPASPDRLTGITERRRRHLRWVGIGGAIATCAVVVTIALAGHAVLGNNAAPSPATSGPTEQTSTTEKTLRSLDCPKQLPPRGDGGPGSLAPGALAARLCFGNDGIDAVPAPLDTLLNGLGPVVSAANNQPTAYMGCLGGMGPTYLLVVAYPDDTRRQVLLSFNGCGYTTVGQKTGGDPQSVLEAFYRSLREQRANSTPPATVPDPTCLLENSSMTSLVGPGEMVAARLCVSYGDSSSRTSVLVPTDDLQTILDGWRTGARTPEQKGPPCSPTTPTWVLSGVTAWGDRVQITAECDRPTNGDDWVELPPAARDTVDRLIRQAGVQVSNGDEATTAWWLALAWLDAINARATVSYDQTAAEIGRIANRMWVGDPWLPDGALDWDLLEASRTEAPGWEFAWRVPARTPEGQAVFTIVRNSKDDPWRILSLVR